MNVFLLLAAAITGIFLCQTSAAASDDDILFAKKNFIDLGGALNISGTLTGNGIGYRNNTVAISCFQDRQECFVASIEQIGSGQIGRMENPWPIPIKEWSEYEIVAAQDDTSFGCSKITITVTRKNESALWVQEPTNQARSQCMYSETKIYKWTIEDSPGWKKMHNDK